MLDATPKQFSTMNSTSEQNNRDYAGLSISNVAVNGRPSVDRNAKQILILAAWLRSIFPGLNLPINASDEDLKACLLDANVLSQILNKLRKPGSAKEGGYVIHNLASRAEKITRFLAAIADMGIVKLDSTDIEDGSMDSVYNCLWSIRARFMSNDMGDKPLGCKSPAKSENIRFDTSLHDPFSPMSGEERRKVLFESKFLRTLSSPIMSEPLGGSNHQVGHKFHEVFQLKQGRYADLPAAKISEMMKSNSLDNAPTQSLLSVVNGILDESVEKKNGEIPHRVACLLRKVVQEIERRISTQAEHLRTQNNLFKAREEKFQSRIRVLEALASNINEENQCVLSQLQQTKQAEKTKAEEKKNSVNEDVTRLIKERDECKAEIVLLKQELETAKKTYELRCLQVEMEKGEDVSRLMKERDESKVEITMLKQELEIAKKTYELRCLQVKTEKGEDVVRLIKERDESREKITMLEQELETTKEMYELRCLQVKTEKGEDVSRLIEERDENKAEITKLKQELETAKKTYELHCLQVEAEKEEDVSRLIKERDESKAEITMLKQELETTKKTYELRHLQVETKKGEDVTRLIEERDESRAEIISLKQELETAKKTYELRCLQLETENDEGMTRLIKERDESKVKIVTLKQELETAKNAYELRCLQLEKEKDEDVARLIMERDESKTEIAMLKQELETATKTYELRCLQVETEAKSAQLMLKERIKELEDLLEDSSNEVQKLTTSFESKQKKWNAKANSYRRMIEFQYNLLQGVKCSSESVKEEILRVKMDYSNEVNQLGLKLKSLAHAAGNYHVLLAENRKLFNEIQDLKGNIRVYCRIRPFLTGQKDKQMTIEYIGENGEVVIANPTKPGKEGHKLFKFNKVYSPASTQGEVFTDIQPLIRSVLDGYNVCIFAYGQTGSGKTYTMTGPNGATKENWGVNYRALNDLFEISQTRSGAISYEVGTQMVEIYNEQVRDLLSSNASQKKLGILTHSQPFGLAVPDATLLPVNSTSDVIELMDIGLKNRAVGATAMNERSSRSHSIVTIHVRGTDLKGGSSLHGNLHLVDLAGSERVDRSEVTGDRLKEAQHINKSLSALGDVIFALAQKSSHVPYRNSKLTQVLQSSLGGQAKTVMFVQLNPDVNSYSESLSTLKFAERVSGVELGAARSTKEGRDVRELMDQVASLKDTISKRDEEIDRLQLLKDLKNNVYNGINAEKRSAASMNKDVNGGVPRVQKPLGGKSIGGAVEKAGLDHDNASDHSDAHSEADSHHSMDDMKNHNEVIQRLDIGQNIIEDDETLGFADRDYEERIMDIVDDLTVETENDATTESPNITQSTKSAEKLEKPRSTTTISRTLYKHPQTASTTLPGSKEPSRLSSAPSLKKTVTGLKSGKRWQ
ncbi:kinesin-like protein KIN-14P isoform X3 [Benincasa hispida]|uniref:kinesin-like protein KIN-14P isoform X3 n=1 Tax=Benincasa hispida TaxID=102211 RepID=UPI0019023361|nr:kinesin-like protein KIN-14P isoform X3 [Benincasa hispida]